MLQRVRASNSISCCTSLPIAVISLSAAYRSAMSLCHLIIVCFRFFHLLNFSELHGVQASKDFFRNNLNQVRAKEERAERLRREKESSAEKVKKMRR